MVWLYPLRQRGTPSQVPAQAVCSCSLHPSAELVAAAASHRTGESTDGRAGAIAVLTDPVGSRHRRYAADRTRWRRSWRLPACRQQACGRHHGEQKRQGVQTNQAHDSPLTLGGMTLCERVNSNRLMEQIQPRRTYINDGRDEAGHASARGQGLGSRTPYAQATCRYSWQAGRLSTAWWALPLFGRPGGARGIWVRSIPLRSSGGNIEPVSSPPNRIGWPSRTDGETWASLLNRAKTRSICWPLSHSCIGSGCNCS